MHKPPQGITYDLNKLKIALLTLGSLAFVVFSFGMLYATRFKINLDSILSIVVGLIGVSFFGMTLTAGLLKLFSQKPGLLINQEGITDNSSALSGQLIRWKDILGYDLTNIGSNNFILIFVKDPEAYLSKVNWFKRFWMQLNKKFYDTPLFIATNFLKCELEDVYLTIQRESNKYKTENRP